MQAIILTAMIASGLLRAQSGGELDGLRALLDSVANLSDPSAIPSPEALTHRLELIEGASAADVRALIPAASRCLASPHSLARKDGGVVLMSISLRPDSAALLLPVFHRLAPLLDDDDPAIRRATAFTIAAMHPHPPHQVVGIATQRLTDPNRSSEDIQNLISLLLAADSISTPVIDSVMKVVNLRADRAITTHTLMAFGAARCANELALRFIEASLNSDDPGIRDAAVASLEPQLQPVLKRFQSLLMQIAADPSETGPVRATANRVLNSIH